MVRMWRLNKDYFDKYYNSKPLLKFEIVQSDKKNDFVKIVSEDIYINKELVTALFSYKSYVEVLEPVFLREHIKSIIEDLNTMYEI